MCWYIPTACVVALPPPGKSCSTASFSSLEMLASITMYPKTGQGTRVLTLYFLHVFFCCWHSKCQFCEMQYFEAVWALSKFWFGISDISLKSSCPYLLVNS